MQILRWLSCLALLASACGSFDLDGRSWLYGYTQERAVVVVVEF